VSDGTYWVEAGVTPDGWVAVEDEILPQAVNANATAPNNAMDLMFIIVPSLESSF
jgi:hypothetical protein